MLSLTKTQVGKPTWLWQAASPYNPSGSTSSSDVSVSLNFICNEHYLCTYMEEDVKHVSLLHEDVHGIPGMLGSLDCMHEHWNNCPFAYQGAYQEKEKFSTLVLEAIADHNLWFWHAAFGLAGSCNDINLIDVSPLHQQFLDGSHSKIDFKFTIDEQVFNKLFYLVDGIYPQLSCFMKTISIPITKKETTFAGWQEAAQKDVEHTFGVLQSKWRFLASPVEMWDEVHIQDMVISYIILHNMRIL